MILEMFHSTHEIEGVLDKYVFRHRTILPRDGTYLEGDHQRDSGDIDTVNFGVRTWNQCAAVLGDIHLKL